MRTRDNRVWVRLSDKEFEKFQANVKKSGLSREAYMRHLINGYVPKERPDDRYWIVMRQLIGISNNLNQLVKKANTLNFIDVPMFEAERKKWSDFHKEIDNRFLNPEKWTSQNSSKGGKILITNGYLIPWWRIDRQRYSPLNPKKKKSAAKSDFNPPKHEIDSFTRCIFPAIQAYFSTEEGNREYAEWKAKQAENQTI